MRLIDGTQSLPISLKSKLWFTERYPNVSEIESGKLL